MSDTTTPLKVQDIHIVKNKELKKVISASGLGNAVEWFDFSIYGFLTAILAQVYFSEAPRSIQLIATYATFSIPFIVRPLGGAVFGYFGDKFGRKNILSLTIIMMSISTFVIGIIPSYQTIGIMAPILLVLAKIVQGLSVGGEYAGAIVFVSEYSPDRKRGFLASWLDFGSIVGFLAGGIVVAGVSTLMGAEAFQEWGWRIPFIISLPLGFIGLYLRRSLDETPAFRELEEKGHEEEKSGGTMDIVRNNFFNIVMCCFIVIATNTTYYMLLVYMITYMHENLNYAFDHSNLIIIIVMAFMLFLQPLVGYMSDRIGRKPFLFIGSIGLFIMAIPAFMLIQVNTGFTISLGLGILAILLCCLIGVMASILPALFPTDVRFRTLAVSFNVSVMIAGLTPLLASILVAQTGNLYMPAYYLMIVAVVGFFAALGVKETAGKPLLNSPPVASSRAEAKEVLQEHFDDIEDQVSTLEDKIDELQEERQNLVDQHPVLK